VTVEGEGLPDPFLHNRKTDRVSQAEILVGVGCRAAGLPGCQDAFGFGIHFVV
jgi:hypothetical protein